MTFQSAIHRAAVLVKSLAPEQATKLLAGLEPKDLQAVFQRVRSIGNISADQRTLALKSFIRAAEKEDSSNFAVSDTKPRLPFAFLNDASSDTAFELCRNEHPSDVAIMMTLLPAQLAADVLSHFEPAARILVLKKICRLKSIDAERVQSLSDRIEQRFSQSIDSQSSQQSGMVTATRMLSCTDPFTRNKILDEMERLEPELSGEIGQQVFCFHDLLQWNDEQLKQVMPFIDTSLWAPSIKTANPVLRRKILNCFAEQPRVLLTRELETIEMVDSLTAETARGEIVRQIIQLVDQNQFTLPSNKPRKAA